MRGSAEAGLYVRSVFFTLVLYFNWALFLIIGSPFLLGPRRWAMAGLRLHAVVSLWILKVICGTRMEVRGSENLKPGPVIIAAKHQAAWDTFALVPLFRDPALIMKAELLSIPLYGWFCRKFEMVPIKRELRGSALRQMLRDVKERVEQDREILIFPEGTRRAPYASPDYKPGVMLLYGDLDLPVCPVALNSGVLWPRHSMLRYPGTIVVEFLAPLPANLPRRHFMSRLETEIESASRRLADEAINELRKRGLAPPLLTPVPHKDTEPV